MKSIKHSKMQSRLEFIRETVWTKFCNMARNTVRHGQDCVSDEGATKGQK